MPTIDTPPALAFCAANIIIDPVWSALLDFLFLPPGAGSENQRDYRPHIYRLRTGKKKSLLALSAGVTGQDLQLAAARIMEPASLIYSTANGWNIQIPPPKDFDFARDHRKLVCRVIEEAILLQRYGKR